MGKKTDTERVLEGLRKLAFGKINDAVELAFSETVPPEERLRQMQLMNVSSIKRDKGGGVEVQFFDRLRALERLYDYARENSGGDAAENLLRALAGEEA